MRPLPIIDPHAAVLATMDREPCTIPHHHVWMTDGREMPQCPTAVKESRLSCVHSCSMRLRMAIVEAVRRDLLDGTHAADLEAVLDGAKWGGLWRADMLAVKLGNLVHDNLGGEAYDEAHRQLLTMHGEEEFRVRDVTPASATALIDRAQRNAMRPREAMRRLLLRLLAMDHAQEGVRANARRVTEAFLATMRRQCGHLLVQGGGPADLRVC